MAVLLPGAAPHRCMLTRGHPPHFVQAGARGASTWRTASAASITAIRLASFTMQTGPGAENAFGGVAQGYADSVPFLAIPGGNPAPRQGVHPNFESVPNYQGITKWAAIINMPERIPEMVGRAMTHLKHGRLGPVLLEFPGDVAAAEFPGELNYKPVEVHKSGASPEDVRDVVTALLNASAPVINVGQGVLYAEATPELIEFAELTNITVMTTLAGKSAFPETHPLSLGTGASSGTLMCARFLENADLVAGIGTSFTISNFNAAHAKRRYARTHHKLRRGHKQGLPRRLRRSRRRQGRAAADDRRGEESGRRGRARRC